MFSFYLISDHPKLSLVYRKTCCNVTLNNCYLFYKQYTFNASTVKCYCGRLICDMLNLS